MEILFYAVILSKLLTHHRPWKKRKYIFNSIIIVLQNLLCVYSVYYLLTVTFWRIDITECELDHSLAGSLSICTPAYRNNIIRFCHRKDRIIQSLPAYGVGLRCDSHFYRLHFIHNTTTAQYSQLTINTALSLVAESTYSREYLLNASFQTRLLFKEYL